MQLEFLSSLDFILLARLFPWAEFETSRVQDLLFSAHSSCSFAWNGPAKATVRKNDAALPRNKVHSPSCH